MEQKIELPEIKNIKKIPQNFPTDWQTVIFRNYGMVPIVNLAKILKTNKKIIEESAINLGLSKIKLNDEWLKRGYISIIKNNWHLLSYRQIAEILNIDIDKLAFILKEDDFLSVKLGNFKTFVEEPFYFPLSDKQKSETEKIKKIVEMNYITLKKQSFDFFETDYDCNFKTPDCKIGERIIYSYFALYGDSLSMDDTEKSYPDYLLEKYAKLNINGIWIQGLLYQLSYYPFNSKLSEGFETRRKNLKKLISRCSKYGIKVYLYLNEPRGMDDNFFDVNPNIKGSTYGNLSALCTSQIEVKKYLYEAVKDLFSSVPELGGAITITMSENPTHCYSRSKNSKCDCKLCGKRNVEEVASEINNIICKGIEDSKSDAKLIANLWGWDEFMGWDIERTKRGIDLLDPKISVMCVSENGMKIIKGGVKSTIIDYSISNVGPSERSEILLKYAKETGHKILAKVQINNSWECCIVPYIPVFDLIQKHLDNLNKIGIDGLMLSWTLGGYPGGNLALAADYDGNDHLEMKYNDLFGKNYKLVMQAVNLFSEGFKEFPFDLNFLYNGPQNLGAANLWYIENTGMKATMVGFPYDDIESWRGVFDIEILINQLKILSEKWKQGLDILNKIEDKNNNFEELLIFASACYANFNSSYLQCLFNVKKNSINDKKELSYLIDEEMKNVKILYNAVSKNANVGYEASNHYYFNENSLLEKIINLDRIKEQLI